MSGCTIASICADPAKNTLYPNYCKPFSLYKLLCREMSGMSQCFAWRSMCVPTNSTVQQCAMESVPLLRGVEYKNFIRSICGEMGMTNCDKCTPASCPIDALRLYSDLCNEMPTMTQCANWNTLCTKYIQKWPLCPSGNAIIPPAMKMYFHTGFREYILFQGWVPQNDAEFIIAVILIFLFSVGYEFLKYFRAVLEKNHRMALEENVGILNGKKPSTKSYPHLLVSSFLYFVEITLGFLLMLLAMTFNITIFLAVVIGRFVGVLIVGLLSENAPPAIEESCH